MITKDTLHARLEDLQRQFEAKRADVLAIFGAIQDCEYWLSVVDSESPNRDSHEAPPRSES